MTMINLQSQSLGMRLKSVVLTAPKRWTQRLTLASRVMRCSTNRLDRIASLLFADKKHSKSAVLHMNQHHGNDESEPHEIAACIEDVPLGHQIVNKICTSLGSTRNKTEDAVLAIGDEITALFDIAVSNNEAVKHSLRKVVGNGDHVDADEDNEPTIRELIENIRDRIDQFVSNTDIFFRQQSRNAEESWARFEQVAKSLVEIEEIAGSSKVLAINAKIESVRLGERGAAFAIVSNHLSNFSDSIRDANESIGSSLTLMRNSMRQSRDAAQEVERDLGSFSRELVDEVAMVEGQTQSLTEAMFSTLNQITESGDEMINRSRNALSELQFQDPMVQELKRTEHEVMKLQSLLDYGICEDTDLPDLDEAVGRDGTEEREAGEVELF